MKTFLLTFFCLSNLTTIEIVGKYQIINELSLDTLELKKDGTYKYQSRGGSCWTWSDFTGTWELKCDILILHHNFSYEEDATKYIEKTNKIPTNIVTIDITDNFGKPISEFEVNYSSDGKTQSQKTNNCGIVVFNKYTKSARIKIEYETHGNRSFESSSVNGLSDLISISINNQPKTIEKNEEYQFSIKNGVLESIEFPYAEKMSKYEKL